VPSEVKQVREGGKRVSERVLHSLSLEVAQRPSTKHRGGRIPLDFILPGCVWDQYCAVDGSF
jgi:hypothetical protein